MAEVDTVNNNSLPAVDELIKTKAKKPGSINYPMDKLNRKLWENLEETNINFLVGRIKNQNISVIVTVNFDNLEGISISKTLTMFDKRVYIAVAALFNAGNEIITLTQIHYTMGNKNKPAKYQIEKINEAVTKMMMAVIYVDNSQEIDNKYKYKRFSYTGSLLPSEKVSAIVNGQLTDAAIHIFREPPLMTFARERRQLTTFDAKLLQSTLSKTEANLAIEDYLLERISSTKAAAEACKGKRARFVINEILLDTLYKETGIQNRFQKARAIDKIKSYFSYYVQCGFITMYEMKPDRLIFHF